MLHLVMLAALAAVPEVNLAVMPFTAVDVSEGKGALVSEHLATQLIAQGLRVSTPRDIASVLGLERQRQLLGCGDTSCVAEIAGALGVTDIVNGELAKLDDGYRLLVKVVSAANGQPRFARSVALKSEREVFETLDVWAWIIAGKEAPKASARTLAPVAPMVIGGAAMAVGAGFLVSAGVSFGQLQQRGGSTISLMAAQAARANGERDQWIGVGLAGGGAAALIAGIVWFVMTTPKEPVVWLTPAFDGVAFGGTW
ncbi:MAG: hypothetical protein ACO1OB_00310 [Archangium sp.]